MVAAPPRSGTGYLAAVLRCCGVRCGHEAVYTPAVAAGGTPNWDRYDGDVSWLAVPRLAGHHGPVFHQTRDPAATAASMVRTGLFSRRYAFGWRVPYQRTILQAIPDLFDAATPLARADRMLAEWNRRAAGHAVVSWRVEDVTVGLLVDVFDVDAGRARRALLEVPTTVNTR